MTKQLIHVVAYHDDGAAAGCYAALFSTQEKAWEFAETVGEASVFETYIDEHEIKPTIGPVAYVVIQDDPDGPTPELRKHFGRRKFIVLEMLAYDRAGQMVDSLGGMSFFADGGDWARGKFHGVFEIPAYCSHLREIAMNLGLKAPYNLGAPAQ